MQCNNSITFKQLKLSVSKFVRLYNREFEKLYFIFLKKIFGLSSLLSGNVLMKVDVEKIILR